MSKLFFTLLHSVCKKCSDTCELMKKKIKDVLGLGKWFAGRGWRSVSWSWLTPRIWRDLLHAFTVAKQTGERVVPSRTHCCLWPHFISITKILSVGWDGLWTLSYAGYFCHPSFRSISSYLFFYVFFIVSHVKTI